MPVVGRFQGVKFYIYYKDHAPPHVHAQYGDEWVVLTISDAAVYGGRLPPHTLKIAKAWVRKHKAALRRAWDKAQSGQEPGKVGSIGSKKGKSSVGKRRRKYRG